MSDQIKQAICCVCGNLRKCRRPRNYRPENIWLCGPLDRDWHREVGDLKCDECGRITTHAILLPADSTYRDHAESIHKIATGWTRDSLTAKDCQRIRSVWRQGVPQNPNKRHLWWSAEVDEAQKSGRSMMLAICRAEIPVPAPESQDDEYNTYKEELVAPYLFSEVDLEDPVTGQWWYEIDCTDCLYLANAYILDDQRRKLKAKMQEIVDKIDVLGPRVVADLLASFADSETCGS